jgi:chromosome segregation ATPase
MSERIADVRRRLHEVLDTLEVRDQTVARLRHDLEAAGRRLAEEVARRRAAEGRVVELETELARGPSEITSELGGRAAVQALVRHAVSDLEGASSVVLRMLWRRVPEPVRARLWSIRRRLGRG